MGYPEVIQELEFKLVDGKESGKAAGAAGEVEAEVETDTEATEDVTTEEKKSFVLKYAPSLSNVQEGSIAHTLLKAKSKVFGGATNDEETDAKFDEVMKEANESYSGSGDITMEELKKDANDISAEMEASADKIIVKEEAQKALLPFMAKLVLAKNKFLSMASKNKDKKEIEGEGEKEKGKLPSEYAKKDFKFRAEKAAKEAFENAERIAKDVATKVGIIKVTASEDSKKETEEEGIEVKLEEETAAPVPAVTDDEEAKVE